MPWPTDRLSVYQDVICSKNVIDGCVKWFSARKSATFFRTMPSAQTEESCKLKKWKIRYRGLFFLLIFNTMNLQTYLNFRLSAKSYPLQKRNKGHSITYVKNRDFKTETFSKAINLAQYCRCISSGLSYIISLAIWLGGAGNLLHMKQRCFRNTVALLGRSQHSLKVWSEPETNVPFY